MIQVTDVVKRFGAVRALAGVTLAIPDATTVALFGANGSGKSTLLKIVAGLLVPTSGSVELDGGHPRAAKAKIGYLGHAHHLYPYLSASENLNFYAGMYRVDRSHAARLLDAVGLSGKADALVRTFSRGETQRLSLARALLHDPRYLLLDEPFSGLDQATADVFPELIARPGRTTLLVTHDIERGRSIAGTCLTLAAGTLAAG